MFQKYETTATEFKLIFKICCKLYIYTHKQTYKRCCCHAYTRMICICSCVITRVRIRIESIGIDSPWAVTV